MLQELLKYSSDKAYGRKGTGFEHGLLSYGSLIGQQRSEVDPLCHDPGAGESLGFTGGQRNVSRDPP